jgi:riboflavin transporter
MSYIVLWVRIFFGMHSVLSGANYFLDGALTPLPKVEHPLAGPWMDSMTAMGLFGVVKFVETLTGICLLANRFVPLVAELPVSFNIFFMSVLIVHSDRSAYTGTRELVFNLFLMAAYSGYYSSMLSQKTTQSPLWRKDNFADAINNITGQSQGDGK